MKSWIFLTTLLLFTRSALSSEDQERLVNDLFVTSGYNPLIRPVRNITDAISVSFGLTLFQIISVEERTQVMKTNNWIRMGWHDYQLEWDPEEYGNISALRLPCEEIWKPDIVLLNNADGKYEQSYCSNVVIYNDGSVQFIPPSIYKSSCTIDVRYFPFDQQECNMVFGSWTFNAQQVKLILQDADNCELSNYVFSGTWDLMDCPASMKSVRKYAEINYDMILRRKTLFFTINLLTPCILISFLSVLTFYLPADAQEKVTLCISILLALVVFLLLVSKSLPPTSVTMPLISKYLFFTFLMNIITVIICVAVININCRSPRTYTMPRWIRIIFLYWLPIIIFMKRPDHAAKYNRWAERKTESLEKEAGINRVSSVFDNISKVRKAEYSKKVLKAIDAVDYITNHLKSIDNSDEICDDWRYVALVMDRFLFYIFLTVTVAGTVAIIVDAPHIFEAVDQQAIVDKLRGLK